MYYSGTGLDVGLDPTFMLAYDLANLTTQLLKVSRRSIRLNFINKWEVKPYRLQVLQRDNSLIDSLCYGSADD